MAIKDIQLLIEQQNLLIQEHTKKLQNLKKEAVNVIYKEALKQNILFPFKESMQFSFEETKIAFQKFITKKPLTSEDVNSELMEFLIRANFKNNKKVIKSIEKSFYLFNERSKLFFATYTNNLSQAFYCFDFLKDYFNNLNIFTTGSNYQSSLMQSAGIDIDKNLISLCINHNDIYKNLDKVVDTLISMFDSGYKPSFLSYDYELQIRFKIDYENETFYRTSKSWIEKDFELKTTGYSFKEKLKSALIILIEMAEDTKKEEAEEAEEDYE